MSISFDLADYRSVEAGMTIEMTIKLDPNGTGSRFLIEGRNAVSSYDRGFVYIDGSNVIHSGYGDVTFTVNGVAQTLGSYTMPTGTILKLKFAFGANNGGKYYQKFFFNIANGEQFRGVIYNVRILRTGYNAFYKISPVYSATQPIHGSFPNLLSNSSEGVLTMNYVGSQSNPYIGTTI